MLEFGIYKRNVKAIQVSEHSVEKILQVMPDKQVYLLNDGFKEIFGGEIRVYCMQMISPYWHNAEYGDWIVELLDGIYIVMSNEHFCSQMESLEDFETMYQEFHESQSVDWSMSPEQIAYGIALAELGLAEDVKTWPTY